MSIYVQDSLRAGMTLEAIIERTKLHARRHKDYPNLVLLKYDMVDSDMKDPLVRQCRGLILDEANGWMCVTRPFDKFFNLGEPLAADIDWASAKVLEKVDGSLMQLYWYDGAWRVASSGSPDASGSVGMAQLTFADLFWQVFQDQAMQLPYAADKDVTFLFELTTPENRVVCGYEGRRLTLLGARMRYSPYMELDPARVCIWYPNWTPVREFHPSSGVATPEWLQESFQTMDPLRQEGYVVVDKDFNRVKVKHPGYVLAHQLRGSWSPRAALEAVRAGELPELAVHFPEMKAQLEDIQTRLVRLIIDLETHYDAFRGIENQKDFALKAVKAPLGGAPLFSMRSGKVRSMTEFLKEMNVDRLAEALGLTTLNPKTQAQQLEDA